MMGEIFYWLFNMSITASLSGIVVLLIGKIPKLPRRFAYILWLIPFIRMWVPIGVSGKYSLMSLISKATTKTVWIARTPYEMSMTNYVMAADTYFPVTYKIDTIGNIFKAASIIWLIGAVAMIAAIFVLYFTAKMQVGDAQLFCENIYFSDKLSSPAVYGIFRPRIILPQGYKGKKLDYILAHERAHIKNCDNLWRIIAFVTAAVHWFNPLAWLFLKKFLEETELACDERVICNYSESERKDYANALVDCAESRNIFASAFGGAKIHLRINNILSYRKLTIISAIFFSVLFIAIGYVLLTNAAL